MSILNRNKGMTHQWIRIFAPKIELIAASMKSSNYKDLDEIRQLSLSLSKNPLEMFNILIRKKLAPNSKLASFKVLYLHLARTLQSSKQSCYKHSEDRLKKISRTRFIVEYIQSIRQVNKGIGAHIVFLGI